MDTVNHVKSFFKEVMKICEDGRFRLTQFVSGSKDDLQSISEVDRLSIFNQEILPKDANEQALGVNRHTLNNKYYQF